MEKRNTLLLTVIAIATLLVAVVGATFAYFANNATVNNVANLTATTASSSSSFVSTGAELSMNVTAANMVQALGNSTGNLAATSTRTGNFTVSFTAGTTESLTCSYDIMYQWTSHEAANDTGVYAKTTGLQSTDKEFSYKVDVTQNGGTSTSFKAEEQFIDSVAVSDSSAVLVGHDTISNSSTDTATVKEYLIESYFRNYNISQNDNSGKTWTIKFYVANVQC